MARIRAALRLSADPYRREQQRAYLAEREVTVLREAGAVLWVSATESQLPRFAEQDIVAYQQDESETLELPALAFDPAGGDPEPPAGLAAPEDHPYRLVLFAAPPAPGWLDEVTALGGQHVRDIPHQGAVFRLDLVAAVSELDFVLWTGPYHPAYAVDFALTTRGGPFTASTLRELRIRPDSGEFRAGIFDDADPEAVSVALRATGATVRFIDGKAVVFFADGTRLPAIARVPGIAALEPYSAPEPALDRSRVIVATDQVAKGSGAFLIDLDGAGEIAGVMDTGLDTGIVGPGLHPDLAGRVIGAPGMIQPDTNGHGTHVAGIIAASGPPSVVGVAPAASVFPQPMRDNPPQPGNTLLLRNLMIAYRAGVRVHNNSWARKAAASNAYSGLSQDLDRFCFTHPDLLVVFASGNDEQDVVPPGGDGLLDSSVLPDEQVAKNILCVGATENLRDNAGWPDSYRTFPAKGWNIRWNNAAFNLTAGGAKGAFTMSDSHAEVGLFSNRGEVMHKNAAGVLVPVGRIRPDIVAPGTNILSLRSSVQTNPPPAWQAPPPGLPANRYRVLTGTSMAAPHVTGAGVLARQYYRAFFRLLRRPRLLEEVPSGPPATAFVDLPTACSHVDGLLLAWLTPVVAGGAARIMANRVAANLVPLNAAPVEIGTDVGRSPAPRLARHGEATLVLHRQKASGIRLRRLRRDLTADPGFNTVSVSTAASTSAERSPALLVAGDRAAVAWAEDANGTLRFALFDAATGAAVGAPREIGSASRLSPHGSIVHNGSGFALVWIESADNRHRLRFQRLDASGAPIGVSAVVADQAATLRDPHLAWDPRRGRYLVVWGDEKIRLRFLDATGVSAGAAVTPVDVPGGARRPYVAAHPVQGGVLAWEDDIQGTYDVYFTILDASGQPLTGIPVDPKDPLGRHVLRISDTPLSTEGFAASAAPDGGTVVVWQSADEINSDRRGSYAVVVTADGGFPSQNDPNTPLVRDGAYVNHTLATHPAPAPVSGAVSACWAGGRRFLLRVAPQPGGLRGVEVVRTNADGVPEGAYALPGTTGADLQSMLWTGQRVIAVTAPRFAGRPSVRVLDFPPIPGLQPRTLRGNVAGEAPPELGFVPGPRSRILVAYQSGAIGASGIRLAELDATFTDTRDADYELVIDLPAGHVLLTARHGWFRYTDQENLVLAAWADDFGNRTRAWIARVARIRSFGLYARLGSVPVTALAGDSKNAVIEPRPVGILAQTSRQREYLAAFQFRSSATQPWEIRVSRLDRVGVVREDPAAPAPPRRDIPVIFPGAKGWPADTEAIEPQLACTYVDEPYADPGATATAGQIWEMWSPGFGLAFVGKPVAGGNRTLYFTLLDEHGRRVQTPETASIHAISDADADVLDFTLTWTGRHFWLTWVEARGTDLRHRQTAVTRTGSRMAHNAPSAALLRATLLAGATNIAAPPAPLPNLDAGFGWGLLDLRQSLAPTPPVTFHARDDAIGPGATLSYEFEVPSGTQVLRVALTWDDPPGPTVRNPVSLHVVPASGPAGQEYRGNVWNGPVSRLVPRADPLPPVTVNVQQVVLRTPPAGRYRVRVEAGVFAPAPEYQFPAQPIALVFAGSGREVPFSGFTNRNPPIV